MLRAAQQKQQEKFFVGMVTNRSINALKHLNEALQGLTAVGVEGWKLTDELPNTNEHTGVPRFLEDLGQKRRAAHSFLNQEA